MSTGPKKTGTQSPSGSGNPKKTGKRARKALERGELLEALRSEGMISSVEAKRLAGKTGAVLPQAPAGLTELVTPTPELVVSGRVPDPDRPPSYNRDATPLDDHDKKVIVEYLASGFNREAAIRNAGVDYRRFLACVRRDGRFFDQSFVDEVILAENSVSGNCAALVYADALGDESKGIPANISSAIQFIRIKASSTSASFNRKLQAEEMTLRRRVLEQQLNTASPAPSASRSVDFSAIPRESWDDYISLCDQVAAGNELSADDAIRYVNYQAAVARASLAPPPELVRETLSLPTVGHAEIEKE